MPPPGDRPEDDALEQRIRPTPRTGRTAPIDPASFGGPSSPPPEPDWPSSDFSSDFSSGETASFRPDRARMDPVILDLATSRKTSGLLNGQNSRRQHLIFRWLRRAVLLLVFLGLGTGALWTLRKRLKREASQVFKAPSRPAPNLPTPTDRVLDMLEAYLTAPDVETKAGYVLDRARVKPLMEAAYASGRLPEDRLRFGVPQPLEPGVSAVPAKVSGPSAFLLHLMVREEQGEPKLDWETYEQEIMQRFVKFVAKPGPGTGEFRLVLERAHDFSGKLEESVAVRVAAPGSPALAEPVLVRPDLAPVLTDVLSWNNRRRALVRLEWSTPSPGGTPRLILKEVVRWEFLP